MLRILHLIRLISFGTCLTSARSHSGENNTQLFSNTLVPLRYLKGKPLICVTKRKPTHKTVTFSPLRMTRTVIILRYKFE